MKVLVLGASGGCGRWVTRLAAATGHDVRALVRAGTAFDPPRGVEVVRGEVLERGVLSGALHSVDVVISCLGLRRRHPRNPWSRFTSPIDLTSRIAALLVEELPREHIDRVMVISAAGVGDSAQQVSPVNRWLFRNSNIGVAYRDLEEMERILGSSCLDWMAVRPATLTNGQPTGRAQVVDYYGVFARIRRAEVAEWMLARLTANEPFDQSKPMLAARGAHPCDGR